MNVSVFGLGYVGAVIAACLADLGHRVVAVEVNQGKVDDLNAGRSPIVEPGLGEIIGHAVSRGLLRATTDPAEAVRESEVSIVCVGTPSQANGDARLSDIELVSSQIGAALRDRDPYHLVVISSTVPPGTCRNVIVPALATASGKPAGRSFGVVMSPEFLREGNAIEDFLGPARVVIGSDDPQAAELAATLYEGVEAPIFKVGLETAEMVKLTDNAWHALKVAFGNEIGRVANRFDIDSQELIEVFLQDHKLNISERYLRPGFAFGGSCLPKDLRTLTHRGRASGEELPLLNSILPSNGAHLEASLARVLETDAHRIGVLGLAFKGGTDDLRESPALELSRRLVSLGHDVRIYDGSVDLSKMMGSNLAFLRNTIPNIEQLLAPTVEAVFDHAQTVVVANDDTEFRSLGHLLREGQRLIDLVRSREVPATPRQVA